MSVILDGVIDGVSTKPGKVLMTSSDMQSPLEAVGRIAPKLVELTREVLFGDVWERPGLSPRDRSLVTMAALVALNRPEQLRAHVERGLRNGLSRDEIGEMMTHLAFYCGWPAAVGGALIVEAETAE